MIALLAEVAEVKAKPRPDAVAGSSGEGNDVGDGVEGGHNDNGIDEAGKKIHDGIEEGGD